MNGWALPRWLGWVFVVGAAVQTVLGGSMLGVFQMTYKGQPLGPYVNALLACLAQFSHSIAPGTLRLPVWFGPLAAAVATIGAVAGLPPMFAVALTGISAVLSALSASVSNAAPGSSPASAMAVRGAGE